MHETFSICYNAHFCDCVSVWYDTNFSFTKMGIIADPKGFMNGK